MGQGFCQQRRQTCPAPGAGRVSRELMGRFWPGPLTLLLPRGTGVPDAVTAGRRLVGVRMPGHPVALELIRAAGVPVAAPSANRFGHTSPTTAAHVLEDLDGRIDAVLDGGACAVGVESTVVEVVEDGGSTVVYRPGGVGLRRVGVVDTAGLGGCLCMRLRRFGVRRWRVCLRLPGGVASLCSAGSAGAGRAELRGTALRIPVEKLAWS